MKKIVAIVLAMVMVLGLATTAFAATTSTGSVVTNTVTVKAPALYDLAAPGQSMDKVAATITDIKVTTVSGKIEKDVPMYVPAIYEFNNSVYMQVAKANADFALKNAGAYTYLVEVGGTVATAIETYATDVVLDKFVAPVEVVKCGDAIKGTKSAAIYMSGNDAYYADGSDWAVFNGEFVKYDADTLVDFAKHLFESKNFTYKAVDSLGHMVPVAAKCTNCEKTFSVVGAAKFDNTWVKYVNYDVITVDNTTYYVVLNAATAAAPSAPAAGETVESAKTFDAGIAMYVGMSVMAAAGSAVVLKKKD